MQPLLLALLAAATIDPSPQVAGDAPVPGTGFDVQSYTLSLTPELASKSVEGIQEIRFRSLTDGLAALAFSPAALTISEAALDGRPVRISSGERAIVFELPFPLKRGSTATLRFRYRGVPARGITATPSSMYSSYFACDWMVCLQDTPGDKALFALNLHVPRSMKSLSIGTLTGTQAAPGNKVVHRWRSQRPYSPYLFAFAVGQFAQATEKARRADLIYLGEVATPAELRRLFAETPALAQFLSDKAGMGLPGNRYTQLLVPGREAQEAATFSLIGRGELDLSAADPASGWVIAHELAHQWWGNLVTARTWADFWLHEGITTFMTAAWKEHRFGRAAYEAELDVARTRLKRARDMGWDKPLAFAGSYPSLPVRRAVQYSKGALFMDHLRTMLGERAFWGGLRAYTRQHAGGTVTSVDLQRAMERASRRDLSAVFAEWVYP